MSIFKETLEDSIQTQLQARTLVVSGENNRRNQLLPWYLSKNSWVRMTSFVNYTSGNQLKTDGKGKLSVIPDNHYTNEQLSKKYILEGGTLYTKTNGTGLDGILRYGVGTPQAAYGGNIDVRADGTADPDYFRTFGIRPMPGITEMNLRTLGAYGSLFETTVKFYAWDINQLNELEILFMRPGYSVLLEWGWSQYIDYNDDFVQNFTPSKKRSSNLNQSDIYPTVFNGTTINPFENLSQDDIYLKLEALRKKYRHNYDGMLGYVKNFNWTMMTNGGFECTTTLISMGEAINTIKMSSNVNNKVGTILADATAPSTYVYDDYENVLLSLKADVDSKSYDYLNNNAGGIALGENEYRGNWDYNSNYVSKDTIKKTVKTYYPNQANQIDTAPQVQEVEFKEPSETGRYYEYLTLDVWLAIVMSYFNVKSDSKKSSTVPVPLVKFQLPGDNDLCLACKDSISVNPGICQVKNNGAFKVEMSFIGYEGDFDPRVNGINPPMYQFENGDKYIIGPTTYQFYDETLKAGKIKNIFVNISMLLQTYKDMKNASNDEGVIMLDYIKNVLNKISNSLGGLNNFGLSTVGKTQSIMKVVDYYYLENGPNSKTDQKYQFDLLGLGSICRNVSIQSQIFENQSTIVAIAAQSRANLADVYNSSQVYLNAGLDDRVALNKWQGEEFDDPQGKPEDVFYQKLYNFMLYARDYLIGTLIPGRSSNDYKIKIDTTGQANPSSILKQSMLRYNSELNFKALIPFKLKITLDGIGGIVVGQIFTVKQNVLPKNYYDKQLGFVITQINHRLNKNDWETELETQICILDQDRKEFQDFINIKREGFGEYIAVLQAKALIYPILQDFLVYQATRAIIGYAYSRYEDPNFSSLIIRNLTLGGKPLLTFNEVIENTLLNYDQTSIQEYWANNVKFFLDYDSSNVNSKYGINKFKDFVRDWVKVFKSEYPLRSNTIIANNQTLGNLLDQLAGNVPSVGEQSYTQEFEDLLNSIQAELLSSYDVFVPNNSDRSIYAGDKGDLNFDVLLYTPSKDRVPTTNKDTRIYPQEDLTNGFNLPILKSRLDRFIKTKTYMNQAQIAWNYPIPIENSANTRLSDLIPLNGLTMYGRPTSLGHPYAIDDNVVGPFTFNTVDVIAGEAGSEFQNTQGTAGNTWWKNGFNIGQTLAGTIPWTRQATLKVGNLPPVTTFAIKKNVTYPLNSVTKKQYQTQYNEKGEARILI